MTAGTTYADWLATNAPATGFTTDSDNDRIPNGIEHVLGSNPNSHNAGLAEVSSTPTSITFKHTLNPLIASDVTHGYQWSTDLVEWLTSGGTNTGGASVIITPSLPDANHVVTVVITIAAGPSARLFGRLQATKTPHRCPHTGHRLCEGSGKRRGVKPFKRRGALKMSIAPGAGAATTGGCFPDRGTGRNDEIPKIQNQQSTINNQQSSIINHQSSIINHQSSPVPCPLSPVPCPPKRGRLLKKYSSCRMKDLLSIGVGTSVQLTPAHFPHPERHRQ